MNPINNDYWVVLVVLVVLVLVTSSTASTASAISAGAKPTAQMMLHASHLAPLDLLKFARMKAASACSVAARDPSGRQISAAARLEAWQISASC